jgi:hypothetical protein
MRSRAQKKGEDELYVHHKEIIEIVKMSAHPPPFIYTIHPIQPHTLSITKKRWDRDRGKEIGGGR